ncbi:hypothetical protein N658DRAFT_322625 [Parathielavia hyrcaniae]|uniref:Uncharacterized protein n=1 Tax=Parathielavia hyrcaniae TaxID=113614 RepID=A0AAN6T3I8_9PEZI|nr:hypothetical protein N658DRAFT_322625 [Parathielavia hyrcaniae]
MICRRRSPSSGIQSRTAAWWEQLLQLVGRPPERRARIELPWCRESGRNQASYENTLGGWVPHGHAARNRCRIFAASPLSCLWCASTFPNWRDDNRRCQGGPLSRAKFWCKVAPCSRRGVLTETRKRPKIYDLNAGLAGRLLAGKGARRVIWETVKSVRPLAKDL